MINAPILPAAFDLDTEDQLFAEALALRVFGMPRVQNAVRQVEAMFRADATALTRSGSATLEQAVRDCAFCGVTYVVTADPARPRVLWTQTPPHTWHGLSVPGARYNLENPDNIYRLIQIDGSHRYRITGRRYGVGPAQYFFELMDSAPGVTSIGNQIACLRDAAVQGDPDGSFSITVGPEPRTAGNHMQSTPSTRAIFIRDVLSDWELQTANTLRVEMIEGPMTPVPSEAELAERAALLLPRFAAFWLNFRTFMFEEIWQGAINRVPSPDKRIGAWGYVTGARYSLERDAALVVKIAHLNARYIGFQLADPWGMVSTEYIHRTGSLNNSQARSNDDDTSTYVISTRDPGIANWLDPSGLEDGTLLIRWQQIATSGASSNGVIGVAKVAGFRDMRDMRDLLPARVVDDDYRTAQQAARRRAFDRRFHQRSSLQRKENRHD